jgi:hypothetical protein
MSDEPFGDWTGLGATPDSWLCVDCGFNTAPGMLNRSELQAAMEARIQAAINRAEELERGGSWIKDEFSLERNINDNYEVYTVKDTVWQKAGMDPWGGCLCIGCLEKRLGRRLKPKDFSKFYNDPSIPGTPRLRSRRS